MTYSFRVEVDERGTFHPLIEECAENLRNALPRGFPIDYNTNDSLADILANMAVVLNGLKKEQRENRRHLYQNILEELFSPLAIISLGREAVAHACPHCKGPAPGVIYRENVDPALIQISAKIKEERVKRAAI